MNNTSSNLYVWLCEKKMLIEHVRFGEIVYAIILRYEYHNNGIEFFTPPDFSQQLGYMKRRKGYKIAPHIHKNVQREVKNTSEVLFIKSGRLRANFFNFDKEHVASVELKAGDVVLLAEGGHGFEMLEDTEIIEVKQGPYAGDQDKEKFFCE